MGRVSSTGWAGGMGQLNNKQIVVTSKKFVIQVEGVGLGCSKWNGCPIGGGKRRGFGGETVVGPAFTNHDPRLHPHPMR